MHAKNGWLPLYSCVAEMPVEVGEVFEYCLCSDQAAATSDKMLQMAQQKQSELWQTLKQ